jgi:hypothetical protein
MMQYLLRLSSAPVMERDYVEGWRLTPDKLTRDPRAGARMGNAHPAIGPQSLAYVSRWAVELAPKRDVGVTSRRSTIRARLRLGTAGISTVTLPGVSRRRRAAVDFFVRNRWARSMRLRVPRIGMFVNVARSRFLLITGLYLALASGCGRLAYETLSPLRTDQDAGDLESEEPIPVDEGGSTASPASSPSTTTPHDSTATDALDRASSGRDGHTSDSTSHFTSYSTSGVTTTPLSSVVSNDDAASETPDQKR